MSKQNPISATVAKNRNTLFTSLHLGTLIWLLTQLFIASSAYAECTREGQTYQTGDTVGPYICMPDGTWQQK